MKSTLINDLNSRRQQTIDRLQSKWQDATFKLIAISMFWFLFYYLNQQWLFFGIFVINWLANIVISLWLKSRFPKIEEIECDDQVIFDIAGKDIEKAGTPVYRELDGRWYKTK